MPRLRDGYDRRPTRFIKIDPALFELAATSAAAAQPAEAHLQSLRSSILTTGARSRPSSCAAMTEEIRSAAARSGSSSGIT